jgi:hypothetical protein
MWEVYGWVKEHEIIIGQFVVYREHRWGRHGVIF